MKRRRHLSRTAARVVALAVIASGGLALALGIGLPDPGAAERAYGALIGLLSCLLALRWLLASAAGRAPHGRFGVLETEPERAPLQPPAVAAADNLTRALGLGVTTIGSYNLLVLPRLQGLARAALERADSGLGDSEGAAALLGDGWQLVDPAAPRPSDRMAPGWPIERIEQLVEALERLA
jgi:hypothetical protein